MLDLFALSGRNYLEEPSLGPTCHQERVKFEQSLIKNPDLFWQFYDALAKINLGREIILVAKVSE
jgi:hypothetical protein